MCRRRCRHKLMQYACSSTYASPKGHDMLTRQLALYNEASSITKALYRRCLGSIKVIAKGNESDEIEFAARESKELSQFDDDSMSKPISSAPLLSPPVNRANELLSRANYYAGFCRENFEGHWNVLGVHGFHIDKKIHGMGYDVGGKANNQYQSEHHHIEENVGQCGSDNDKIQKDLNYAWSEGQIEKFVYLIRSGEEKRTWILQDYEFVDPFISDWPKQLESRLDKFEEGANSLVKEMYKTKGWMHSSDVENALVRMVDEDDSDDEDDL